MNEKLRQHIDKLFSDAPQTVKMVELKEEMLQNLTDKYNDLIAEGKAEEAAFNIAVASIGEVSELLKSMQTQVPVDKKAQSRHAMLCAVAIALYVLCVTPIFLLQNEFGVVLMFVLIAIATGMLIYDNATKDHYMKNDDTMVEEFKAWKQGNSQLRQAEKAIVGSVWLVMVCAYFVLSYLTGAWQFTWLIFLIAAAISSIVRGIINLKAMEGK
ncbi:MAG: permease prefix domain 1-containing protein [Clostridia bacterium]